MKKQIFLLVSFFIASAFLNSISAQDMYGTASEGGLDGVGTIYKLDSTGRNQQAVYHFQSENTAAQAYYSKPCELNGKIYGTTYSGGPNDRGVVYEFNIGTGAFTVKANFNFGNGSKPFSDPIVAKNGKLYGLTSGGGASNRGALYEYNTSTGAITLMASMNDMGVGTSNPNGRLVETTNNIFYGTTSSGGDSSRGVFFKYDLTKDSITALYHFSPSKGYTAGQELLYAKNGNVYGITSHGGLNNKGGLWEYNTTTGIFKTLVNFSVGDAPSPRGGLVEFGTDLLYGMSATRIFEYNISTDSLTIKQSLNLSTGQSTEGSFTQSNGKLYTTTRNGGDNYSGTVLEYNPTTNTTTVKYSFEYEFRNTILGSPLLASNGKLYGSTLGGGTSGRGVLFELDLSTKVFKTKSSFSGTPNGGWPSSGLIRASNKKLYGMTSIGGSHGKGVLYSFDPKTSTYTKHHDFEDTTGSSPHGMLTEANDGYLYGMTSGGGRALGGNGVLFKFDPSTNTYTSLAAMDNNSGSRPEGNLIQASNGKFYGMTTNTNTSSIFEYTIGEDTFKLIHKFVNATGKVGYGSLLEAENGKLYGMTSRGGANGQGVLFELVISTKTYRVVSDFNGSGNGSSAYGSLIKASNGKMYGMTYGGGSKSIGVLFEYDVAVDSILVKVNFTTAVGRNPQSTLMQAQNGKLYGYTGQSGTIIEYDIVKDTIIKTVDMTITHGRSPNYGSLLQYFETNAPCNLDTTVNQTGATLTSNASGVNYQWMNCSNNSLISGETNASYTATKNGNYAVIISTSSCKDTSNCTQVSGLGLGEFSTNQQVSVYPNPTQNNIHIATISQIEEIKLVSLSGAELISSEENNMDLSELPAGIYILQITLEGNQKTLFKKIVKE